ncbi:crossover junction endodeoxyribonuclease RuvC [Candidatus Giovannonibacteria bacterium]|nr:crossover junction endodeoxyribonuclease RuvC [Candidatus Giovannonibacteria bacterium]
MPTLAKRKAKEMVVLGIDPGIERLGWGLVKKNASNSERLDSGVKKTSQKKATPERLYEIEEFMDNLLSDKKPDLVSIEKLFFSKNVKTALLIGEVRGVILAVTQKHRIPIREFSPSEIKIAVCGYGQADKKSVAEMLRLQIEFPQRKMIDDETDALACALCGIYSR